MSDMPSYRLKKESLAVLVGGKHIGEVTAMSVTEALVFFDRLELTEKEVQIARLILREIRDRLGFCKTSASTI
ncbi:UvrABC system protein A [Geobacillus sp. BCO2]|nr:UvrABC system protein A [Geobacillus sp. BCO2]